MDSLLPLLTVIFLVGNIILAVVLFKRRSIPDETSEMPAQMLGEMKGQISEIGRSHSDQQKAQAEQKARRFTVRHEPAHGPVTAECE